MAWEWAPPALYESFIWDRGLWKKWGYPPNVQQLYRGAEKGKVVLGRVRGALMFELLGYSVVEG